MSDNSLTRSGSAEIDAFLDKVRQAPAPAGAGRGRLIFALDATASRQPSRAAVSSAYGKCRRKQ